MAATCPKCLAAQAIAYVVNVDGTTPFTCLTCGCDPTWSTAWDTKDVGTSTYHYDGTGRLVIITERAAHA